MTKKVIIEKRKETRIIQPAKVETIIKEVPQTVYFCDYCETKGSLDEFPVCLGCGKHACYWCKKYKFEEFDYQVGTPRIDGGDYEDIPASEDYRYEFFYLCPECAKNLPGNLKVLTQELEVAEKVVEGLNNKIIDEVIRLRKKNE